MKAQVGLYKFGRHYNHWGIWQYDWVSETGSSARFIKDVYSYEEAVAFAASNSSYVGQMITVITGNTVKHYSV
jgi:hypothetical protein